MAIGVDQIALTDSRFASLGRLLSAPYDSEGFNRPLPLAAIGIGVMVYVWNECQERSRYVLKAEAINAIGQALGILSLNLSDAICKVSLGVVVKQGIRLKGTKGRIEWREKLKEQNRIRQARHRASRSVTNALVTRESQGSPTPTPTPTLSSDSSSKNPQKQTTRVSRARYVDPPGFAEAWKAYPHYETRSSRKTSANAWAKLGLTDHFQAVNVLAWIARASDSDDWTRENGRFVPGMQVWLKTVDALHPPATNGDNGRPEPFVNRLLTPEEKAHIARFGRL